MFYMYSYVSVSPSGIKTPNPLVFSPSFQSCCKGEPSWRYVEWVNGPPFGHKLDDHFPLNIKSLAVCLRLGVLSHSEKEGCDSQFSRRMIATEQQYRQKKTHMGM